MRIPVKTVVALSALVPILIGVDMLKGPLLIPEASQPAGFPRPGKVNQIEVKSYPSYRSAKVQAPDVGQNKMFGQLFDHIKKNEIAMTAPVEMTFGDSGPNSMAFLYKAQQIGEVGADGEVQVADQSATQVVSMAIRGSYAEKRFDTVCEQLREWLAQSDEWEESGEARYFGYNSPFIPSFLRYGEVQIPVRPRT